MTAIPRRAEINQYGLPAWIGGWVRLEGTARPVSVRALLDGAEVGATQTGEPVDEEGRGAFTITFAAPIPPGAVASGRLTLWCRFDDEAAEEPIPNWEILTGVDAIAEAMASITAWKAVVGDHFASIAATLPKMFPERIEPLFSAGRPAPPTPAEALARDGASPVHLPVGLVSKHDDAVLGRKGFVFLKRGSAPVFDRYAVAPDDPEMLARAEAWRMLIAGRIAGAEARGIGFLQTIVPDKVSVLPDLLPADIALRTPTPLLAALERRLQPAGLRRHYLSALALLQSGEERVQVFRRIDTRLTPFGAYRLAKDLARQMGHPITAQDVFARAVFADADIGDRFFDVRLLDQINEAVLTGPLPDRIEEAVPGGGRNEGRMQVWRQPAAPIKKRLVLFGNAFSNLPDAGQGGLSHWLARWFAEFHFVWSPACDWAYVDMVKPDLVLCQTIERFLDTVPAT